MLDYTQAWQRLQADNVNCWLFFGYILLAVLEVFFKAGSLTPECMYCTCFSTALYVYL